MLRKIVLPVFILGLLGIGLHANAVENYELTSQTLRNTQEGDLIVRVGDIDNLGFGWPEGFDVFSGQSTPRHPYPWEPEPDDPSGTDQIMVGTSYDGHPPAGQDGYTGRTSRLENLPKPISVRYDLGATRVRSAVIQMFVDDFQAPVWKGKFQVTLNGQRASFLENVLNSLNQTGPIGKLITVQVPVDFLNMIAGGSLEIYIDDPTTGAGDGFAIDFVRLIINPRAFKHTGRISGSVKDGETGRPIQGVTVSAAGIVSDITESNGVYVLENVPAGLAVVTASKPGYASQTHSIDVPAGTHVSIDFSLAKGGEPLEVKEEVREELTGTYSQGRMDGARHGRRSANERPWGCGSCCVSCGVGIGLSPLYCSCPFTLGISGVAYLMPPSPPAHRLVGKSSEYITGYTEAYKNQIKTKRTTAACIGGITGCCMAVAINYIVAEIIELAEEEDK